MLDQHSQQGQEWLTTLLKLMGISAQVIIEPPHDGVDPTSPWLVIDSSGLSPDQLERLLGYKGEGIDAIQYLTNTLVNLGLDRDAKYPLTVEINGYRQSRQGEILTQVQQLADQVRRTGQEIELPDLSSAERRQVHALLQDVADLETESRGQEPDRRLVIRLR